MEGGLVGIVSCRRGAKSYVRQATFVEPDSGLAMVIAEAVPRCACGDVAAVCARCALSRGGRMAS